jgi:aspartate/methionine/tyrosine aminotransferase
MAKEASLFSSAPLSRPYPVPLDAKEAASRAHELHFLEQPFVPAVNDRMLEVFARANRPDDPIELRDLWLGRIECELGRHSFRAALAQKWRNSRARRQVSAEEILASRSTVGLVKELFNYFFRDDLYGELRSDHNLILSSGSVDEEAWGLPDTLKACIRYALERDWYGYSDSRGREPAREAVAAYESARIDGALYRSDNVALTMGGTFAISSLLDFILPVGTTGAAALCGIPNYPPLVQSLARRRNIQLVPLPSQLGQTSLAPLTAALAHNTPLVLLQTVANPTGALISDEELARLVHTASPSTIILLDECHEWLGPLERCTSVRAAPNVVRVFSLSKGWSAPGLKIGWFVADAGFIAEYYEYASTMFGGPPSLFYTLIEVLARMERWRVTGVERLTASEFGEFESGYQLTRPRLEAAYRCYCAERAAREDALKTLRDATMVSFAKTSASIITPRYSINMAVEFPQWDDSYRCFRDLLRKTEVAVFPGILTFCFSGGVVRVTTSRQWADISSAISRLDSRFPRA